jgi:hypothetical protein
MSHPTTQTVYEQVADNVRGHMLANVLKCLNSALDDDYLAMVCMMNSRVPVNEYLQDHKYIPTVAGTMSTIGLINGVLNSIGLPLVCTVWGEESNALLGFEKYPLDKDTPIMGKPPEGIKDAV